MGLAKFSKRFPDMEEEGLSKFTFPYRLNRPEFYGKQIPFPDEEFFYDEFHTKAAVDNYRRFKESWPDGQLYCFNTEMHKYLRQDVVVLRGGCVRLLKEMLDFQDEYVSDPANSGRQLKFFHPFTGFFTSSSFAHSVFLYFELEENTVYLLVDQRNARKTSAKERFWLDYLTRVKKRDIRTEWNHENGAAKLGGYYPDGLEVLSRDDVRRFPPGAKYRVYEMMGCQVGIFWGRRE